MNTLSKKISRAGSPLLILFALGLPLSTSAGSILAILLIVTALFSANSKEAFRAAFKNPVVIAIVLYIALHIIGLLWTEDMTWGFEFVQRQWKLLLLPVFITVVKKEHVPYYLGAFVLAITLKACKAYLVWLGIIILPPASIFTTLGTSHVVYNPMLALTCYIVLQNILFGLSSKRSKYLQIVLFLFLACNMFITVGRTGQIAFFVLLMVIFFQYFYTLSKTKLILCLALLPLLIAATYMGSSTFKSRIDLAISESKNYSSHAITSVGLRIWFSKNSLLIIKENWLSGVGTGDFPMEYAKVNSVMSPDLPATDNPHSQYLLLLSQFGIIGIISLLGIFGSQLVMAFGKKDNLTPLRQAFPLFFLVIMLAESYLQVYATGFLFALFSSFLYKEYS